MADDEDNFMSETLADDLAKRFHKIIKETPGAGHYMVALSVSDVDEPKGPVDFSHSVVSSLEPDKAGLLCGMFSQGLLSDEATEWTQDRNTEPDEQLH